MSKILLILSASFMFIGLSACGEHSHDDGSHSHDEAPAQTKHETID